MEAKYAKVSLTIPELHAATQLAVQRALQSVLNKNKDRFYDNHWIDNVRLHIAGALGETAVAKYLGVYMEHSFNTWKKTPDISLGPISIEVRTRTQHDGNLIVRQDDDPKAIYILATGDGEEIRIQGWIKGAAAQKDEYKKDPNNMGPAFFVPQDKLEPIYLLEKMLRNPTFRRAHDIQPDH